MDISVTDIGPVKVFRLDGNLDTNTSSEAQEHLSHQINEGATKVLVNLEKVDFVSSAGLRVLLATAKQLGTVGGALRISDLNETVKEVFEISGFSTILDVFSTETEALDSF